MDTESIIQEALGLLGRMNEPESQTEATDQEQDKSPPRLEKVLEKIDFYSRRGFIEDLRVRIDFLSCAKTDSALIEEAHKVICLVEDKPVLRDWLLQGKTEEDLAKRKKERENIISPKPPVRFISSVHSPGAGDRARGMGQRQHRVIKPEPIHQRTESTLFVDKYIAGISNTVTNVKKPLDRSLKQLEDSSQEQSDAK